MIQKRLNVNVFSMIYQINAIDIKTLVQTNETIEIIEIVKIEIVKIVIDLSIEKNVATIIVRRVVIIVAKTIETIEIVKIENISNVILSNIK